MQEKQTFTYTQGPNKLTYIEARKAKQMRAKGILGGVAVGLTTMGAAMGIIGHKSEVPQPTEKTVETSQNHDNVPTKVNEAYLVTDTVGSGGTIDSMIERNLSGIDPSEVPEIRKDIKKINHITNEGIIQPDQPLRMQSEYDGIKTDVNAD